MWREEDSKNVRLRSRNAAPIISIASLHDIYAVPFGRVEMRDKLSGGPTCPHIQNLFKASEPSDSSASNRKNVVAAIAAYETVSISPRSHGPAFRKFQVGASLPTAWNCQRL